MNGVHFNYTNTALHGAHYRKDREEEREGDRQGTGKIGVAEKGMKKKGTLGMKGGE